MPNVELLTTAEVAARLGVHVRTVHRWVQTGRISPVKRAAGIRGAMLFDADDVDSAGAAS